MSAVVEGARQEGGVEGRPTWKVCPKTRIFGELISFFGLEHFKGVLETVEIAVDLRVVAR